MARNGLKTHLETDKPPVDNGARIRDFTVIVGGAVAILMLLAASNALGWVEAATAAIVIATGSGAYFVGSSQAEPSRPSLIDRPRGARARERARAAVDLAPIVNALPWPALHVGRDGRLDATNPAARAIFRIQETQNGLASAVLRSPVLLTALDQAIARDQHQTVEYDPPGMGDGVWRAHVRPMARVSGGALLMLEDRTEARRAEQARADFLANASHELRTPLTSLAGFIETMRGPARDDKESWDRFLDIMFEQTERMRRLIADLLSLSRIEFSEHRPPQDTHDLASIVAKATQALVPIALERNIALTFNAPGGEARVIADADEMTQAIQNLITNAVKYSPDGGHVAVELGTAPTLDDAKAMASRRWQNGARMTILEAPRNEAAAAYYLRVTDEGPGIAREHLPRLGQRFYRVDASRGGKITGTGLGLAIVKHVMTRHRGGFVVETVSGEGSGSGFGFWLPAAHAEPANAGTAATLTDGETGRTQP